MSAAVIALVSIPPPVLSWLGVGFCIATLLVVVAAQLSQRVDHSDLRAGLIASLFVGAGCWFLVSLLLYAAIAPPGSLFHDLGLAAAVWAGAIVGGFIFVTSAFFLALGLLRGASRSWALSAWLIGPVISLLAIGVVYVVLDRVLPA